MSQVRSQDLLLKRSEFAAAMATPSGTRTNAGHKRHGNSEAIPDADHCSLQPLTAISMKHAAARFGLGAPAAAQQSERTQSVEVYEGELFGDNLTDAPLSGRTPRLNDNATFGARYYFNFTDVWGIQLSGGHSPNRAARVPGGLEHGRDHLGHRLAVLMGDLRNMPLRAASYEQILKSRRLCVPINVGRTE